MPVDNLSRLSLIPSRSLSSGLRYRCEVSAGEQMRFTNNTEEAWSSWEPYAPEKPWTLDLDCAPGEQCVVYAQFKDAADNESLVVYDEIFLPQTIYLPLVLRNY